MGECIDHYYFQGTVSVVLLEYVTKEVADTAHDAKSVADRNATTLFLTELMRGNHAE